MSNNLSIATPGQGPNGKGVKFFKNGFSFFKKDEIISAIEKHDADRLKKSLDNNGKFFITKKHLSVLKKSYLENAERAFEIMLLLGKNAVETGQAVRLKLNELRKRECDAIINKAVKKNSPYRIFEAIAKGADINIKTDDYANKALIIYASIYGSLKVAEMLISLGADVNHKDTFRYNGGWTPVFFAASNGYLEMIKLFAENNANLNEKDAFGKTPLHWAVSENQKEIILFLISRKVDLNAKSNDGMTPLKLAKHKGYEHQEVAFILEKHGAKE